jgi:hypothetical protein
MPALIKIAVLPSTKALLIPRIVWATPLITVSIPPVAVAAPTATALTSAIATPAVPIAYPAAVSINPPLVLIQQLCKPQIGNFLQWQL